MSEAYERERQNNARLDELSHKVSALRGVTVDIYDQASSHSLIDSTVGVIFSLYPCRPCKACAGQPDHASSEVDGPRVDTRGRKFILT